MSEQDEGGSYLLDDGSDELVERKADIGLGAVHVPHVLLEVVLVDLVVKQALAQVHRVLVKVRGRVGARDEQGRRSADVVETEHFDQGVDEGDRGAGGSLLLADLLESRDSVVEHLQSDDESWSQHRGSDPKTRMRHGLEGDGRGSRSACWRRSFPF